MAMENSDGPAQKARVATKTWNGSCPESVERAGRRIRDAVQCRHLHSVGGAPGASMEKRRRARRGEREDAMET